MTTEPAASLRTCPDCGGILEPIRPEYLSRLDADAALHGEHATPGGWRCFLCGYRERVAQSTLIAEV
jgi:hypothetical protein